MTERGLYSTLDEQRLKKKTETTKKTSGRKRGEEQIIELNRVNVQITDKRMMSKKIEKKNRM